MRRKSCCRSALPLVLLFTLLDARSRAIAQIGLCAPDPSGQTCSPVQCPNIGEMCLPRKIRYNATTGQYMILECECGSPNRCHVRIPAAGGPPQCVGGCPEPGADCIQTVTPVGPGVADYECTCGSQTEACCFRDSTCQDLPPALCVASGGRPQGAGTHCATTVCYKNWVIADDFVITQGPAQPIVRGVRWWGSWLDPQFDPIITPPPNLRKIDGWFLALHSDVPAVPCPPPPTGSVGVDFCGKVTALPNCPPTFLGFTPDGSATTYVLLNFVAPPGTRVRICGFLNPPNCTPCPGTAACLFVQQALDCDQSVSRPRALLVQWALPTSAVAVDTINLPGCDGHPIFVYTADLAQACLEHINVAGLAIPGVGFAPQQQVVYWLSIQAEVGADISSTPSFACVLTPNGNQVRRPFWGWHTTHPEFHHIDDAFMGMVGMECAGDWLYRWLNHLHWSQPEYIQCADIPTASIDMAFELLTAGGVIWSQPAVTFGLRGIDIHSDIDWDATPQECLCKGDLNLDGKVNGVDIQTFVNCYIRGCAAMGCPSPPSGSPLSCPCLCADMNGDGALAPVDIGLFVTKLLTDPDTLCP